MQTKHNKLRTIFIWVLMLSMALPGITFAQDDSDDAIFEIRFTGTVEAVGNDFIVVNGYLINADGEFDPADLAIGDTVTITGLLLDDDTIQVTDLEILDDNDASEPDQDNDDDDDGNGNGRGNGNANGNGNGNGRGNGNANGNGNGNSNGRGQGNGGDDDERDDDDDDERDDDNDEREGCGNNNHPVAESLSSEFGVSYDNIMLWHCDGDLGFGDIARSLRLAELSGDAVEIIMARRLMGEGWGEILRDYDISPSELAPGRAIGNGNGNANGNGNGNANGNSNGTANGNGNGNANGNSNGNGNGRGNGNTNGNSNGNN